MHVRVEGVNRLDDGFVANLGEGVALLAEGVDLRHHAGAVDARGEGVEGDVLLDALGAHLLANLPHRAGANLAHGEGVEALARHHHGANLVSGLHLLVALVEDILAGHVRGGVRPLPVPAGVSFAAGQRVRSVNHHHGFQDKAEHQICLMDAR